MTHEQREELLEAVQKYGTACMSHGIAVGYTTDGDNGIRPREVARQEAWQERDKAFTDVLRLSHAFTEVPA